MKGKKDESSNECKKNLSHVNYFRYHHKGHYAKQCLKKNQSKGK
jgi:hypothetical protein